MNQLSTIKIPAFEFTLWQWEITRRLQNAQPAQPENGITRPRYPVEEIHAHGQIQLALKTYRQLIVQKDWIQAILHYRLNLHEHLFYRLMEFREVTELLQPFFDPDFTQLIRELNESAQAFICLNTARCLAALGYPHKAEGLILAHNRLRRQTGDTENHAWGLLELVRLRQFPGRQLDEATSSLAQVLKVARKQNFPSLLAATYLAQAQLHLLKQDLSPAANYLISAECISRGSNDFAGLSQVFCGWSHFWLQQQHYFAALNSGSKALRLAARQNSQAILQAQIAHGKAATAALIYARQTDDAEKQELHLEAVHTIAAALKHADQHGLVFELLDAATEALRLAWWDFKTAPRPNQALKPELVPFTQLLIQHAEQIGWQLKLPELHGLLIQLE
jgi:hypothetical protein